jgi:hypothetical protein
VSSEWSVVSGVLVLLLINDYLTRLINSLTTDY